MAKDILIVPGSSNIHFSGSAVNDIKLETQDSGSVAFTSNSGSILTLTNSFTGSLFSVGDVSGVPILDVNSDDTVTLGQFSSPLKIYTNTSSHTIISGSSTSTGSFGRLQATTISGNSPLNIEGTPNFTGNVLIGKTSSAFGTAGTEIFANGSMWVTKANGNPVGLNRTGGAGSVLEWYDDASIKGALGTATSYFLNNVGIGTATPSTSRRLHIHNTDDTRGIYVYNSSATSYAEIHMKANREFRIGTGGASSAAAAQNNFYIYDQTATAHRFTINSSGKVGIGETSPDKELHLKASEPTFRIEQTAEANKYFDMNVGTGGGTSKLKFSSEAQANTLVISNNARVGINQGSAAEALDVVGNGLISGNLTVGGTLTAQSFVTELTSTTILYDSGSTKFGNTSDDTHQMTGSLKVSGSLTLQNGFSLTPSTSNYALLGGWLNVGTIGLFSGTNGAHIYPNVGSEYGAWRMNGSRNGYGGISFEVGGHYNVLMSNATYMGFYDDTNNEWMLRGTVNGATYLYYNGTSKFETTSTGATVTGTDSNNTRLGISNTSSGDAFLLLDASNGDFAGSDYAYIKQENSTLDLVIASDSNAGKVRLISKNSNTMALDGSNVTIASTAAPNNSAKLGVAGNINVGNGQASSIVYFENSGTDMYIEGNANKLNIGSVGNTQRVTFPAGGGMHMNAGNVSGSSTSTGSFGGVYSAGVSRFIGNVGIGVTDPDVKLEVAGDVKIEKGTNASTQNVMGIGRAGNIESSGGGNAFITVHGNTNNQSGQIELGSANLVGDGSRMGRVFFYNLDGGSSVVSRAQITAERDGADDASKLIFATEPTSGNITDRMVIKSDGNVGIGVAAPEVKLHVKETDSAFGNTTIHVENAKADDAGVIIIEGARTSLNDTGQLIFANSNSTVSAIKTFSGGGSNDHGDLRFYTSADGTGNAMTQQMTISTAGNVGIGTNNPGSKLEIWQGVGNGSSYDVIKIDGNTGNYGGMWMTGQWSAGQSGRIGFWGDSTSNKGVGLIGGAGTTPNLFVNASGKVGIGTTSPTSLLHVSASNASARVDGEGSNSALILNNNNAYWEIYNHHGGGGNLKFYSGGADRVTFATSGYVGIGSTSPYSALNVRGANTANGNAKRLVAFFDTTSAAAGTGAGISLGGYTNGTGGDINDLANIQGIKENGSAGNYASALTFQTRANGAGTAEQMRIASTGNIGIGTTAPAELLHINAGSSNNAFIKISTTGTGEAGLYIDGDDGDFSGHWTFIGVDNTNNNLTFNNVGADDIVFKTTNAERVRIDASGNVGIGTTTSTQRLSVRGDHSGDGINTFYHNNTNPCWEIVAYGTDGGYIFGKNNSAAVKVQIRTDGVSYFNGGNVGIGTTSPTANLNIYDNNTDSYQVILEQDGTGDAALAFKLTGTKWWSMGIDNSDGDKFKIGDDNIISNSTRLTIDTSGNVGIGTTSPAQKLDVYGNITVDAGSIIIEDVGESLQFSDGNCKILRSSNDMSLYAYSGFIFSNNAGEAARFDNSGNLQMASGNTIQAQIAGIYIKEGSSNAFSIKSNGANGYLLFRDEYNSADRLKIEQSGQITVPGAIVASGNITTAGQLLTPSGANLQLNPNTGLVSVGGVIQTSGAGNNTMAGNLVVTGNITAKSFITQLTSILHQSGSTKFGDTKDDLHQFTGSVRISDAAPAAGYSGTQLLVGSGSQHHVAFIMNGAAYGTTPAGRKTILKLVNNATAYGAQYNNGIEFSPYHNKAYAGIYGYWHTDTGYYNLAFRTTSDGQNSNQVTAMTIDEGQRVGIGVTNPLNPLHVEKALNSDWIAKFKNTGTTNAYGLQIDTSANTGTGEFSLGVYTGTNSGFFVTSDAKVGIGTTAPTHQLSIYNSGAGTDMTIGKYAAGKTVGVLGTSADTSGYFQIQSYLSQGSTFGNIVLNAQGGNVGIGTATPARKLEVSSDTDTYVEIATTNAGADTWMYFRNDGDNNAATDFRMGRSNTGAFVLGGGSGATALYIDSSHNVGIGTVPSFPLSVGKNTNTSRVEIGTSGVTTWQSNVYSVLTVGVSGSHAITQDGSANSQQWFNIYDTGNKYRAYAGYGGNWMFTASTGTLAYRNTDTTSTAGSQITDLTAKFAIDKIGRVGIGTDTPVEAITIRGTSNGTDGFHYPAIAGYTTTTKLWALEQHFGDEGRLGLYHGGNLKVLMRASGSSYINNGATMNFGIGTASPSYKLDVSGTGRFAGDVTIGTGSDSRIKFVSGTSRAHIGPDQNVELRFGYANASDKNFYHNTTNVAKINGSGITVPSGNISGSSVSTGSFGRIDLHQGLYFNREAAGNAIFEGRAHYQSPFVKFDAYNRGRIAFGADVSGNTFFLVDGEMTHTWTGGELYGSYFNTKIWPNVDRNATIIRVQGEIERNSNSGTHGWFKGTDFKAPTVHNGTATVVNTATVFIDGAMSAGTTNNYSLYNASTADSYFGGKVGMGVTDLQYVSKLHLASTGHNIAMRISDSSLGIGLDFGYDDAGYTEAAIYNKYDSNDSSKITFGFGTALSTAPVMTLLKSGNLGLGTESPDYQLELEKAGGGFLSFKTTDTDLQNNDVLGTIQFAADDATASGIDIGAKIVATVTDNFQSAGSNVDAPTRLDFFTQDNTTTDVMSTVGATLTLGGDDQNAVFRGNVGIGIAVPTTKLHVYNLGTGLKVEAAGEAPYTQKIAEFKYLGNGNSLDIINIGGKASLNSDSGLLNLGTAGYARLTITSSGLVGIGVTPTAQLHVNGGAWNANMILQGGASESAITMMGSDGVVDGFVYANGGSIGFLDDDGNWAIQCKTDDYTAFHINNSEKMRITSAGNVGIGTTTPLSRLDVFEELTVTGVNGTEAHMRITDGRAGDVGNSYNLNRGARLGLGGHQGSGYAIFGAIDGRKYNSNINDQRGYLTFSVQAHEGGSWDLYEKMRINNDGNVGIGVTDPASFHGSYNNLVVGTGTGDNGITIYGASSGIAFADGTSGAATYAGTITYNHGVDKFYIGGSGNTQQVTIQGSNGNVGIGDTTPSYKLDVAGTGNFTGGLFLVGGNDTLNGHGANLGGAYDLYVGSQSSGKGSRIILNSGHTTGEFVMQARQGSGYSNGNIGFYRRTAVTTFSTLLHIGGDGKIGMGTESPDNNLHIFKGSAGTVTSDGNSQLTIEHSDHASLQFLTPNNKQQQILFGDPDDTDIGYINYNHNTNTMAFAIAAAVRMTILSGGQVGIGITNPGVALDVSGTIEATADVIAYASSDERLKENIKTIENPIEKVKQIRGVEFDWKEGNEDIHHNKGHDTGLIAQDVEKVVPEIVKDREDGYKGVRYEKLVGLLVESVKEQQKQIEELQSEIKELKDGSSK